MKSKKFLFEKKIELKLLRPELTEIIPKRSTKGSAGFDIFGVIKDDLQLNSGESKLVPSGIAIHISDKNLAGIILPRSGLGHKKGLVMGNGIGLIDSDYQGEIMVSCYNRSSKTILIKPMTRIAQFILIPLVLPVFTLVKKFTVEKTERNVQGFGHTGNA